MAAHRRFTAVAAVAGCLTVAAATPASAAVALAESGDAGGLPATAFTVPGGTTSPPSPAASTPPTTPTCTSSA